MKDIIGPFIEAIKHIIKPRRISINYPDEYRKIPDNYRGIILFEQVRCVGCRQCCKVCPAQAIEMIFDRGIYMPSIDYSKCIFCELCVDVCPTGALRYVRYQEIVTEDLEKLKISTRMLARGYALNIVDKSRDGREVEYRIEGQIVKSKLSK